MEVNLNKPTKKSYTENIRDTKKIAKRLGIPIILDCGSLLGAYRDGEPIKGDYDDIDFAVPHWVAQYKLIELIQEFQDAGFVVYRLRDTTICFKRNGVKIDFLFYKKGSFTQIREIDRKVVEQIEERYYFTLYFKQEAYALMTKLEAYNNLGSIKYLGMNFDCPADIEKHLEYRYGDWKTPILRPEFSFKNYIELGVMKKI
jgi:phosphorylcholine metabolism protein LicD